MMMESDDASHDDDDKRPKYTLHNLPPELFLMICSYLDAKFVITVLTQVCTKFKAIIDDDAVWKARIAKRWPHHAAVKHQDNGTGIDWKGICIEKEEQLRLWADWPQTMNMYEINNAHDGTLNVIHMFKNGKLCASGSRDRDLKVWDLEKLNKIPLLSEDFTSCLVHNTPDAHSGWIWSFASDDNYLFSSGWDGCVKTWDIRKEFAEVSTLNCPGPVLCLAISDNLMCAGTFNKRIYLFDKRDRKLRPFKTLSYHKNCVLCLAADEKYVISGSEDETVVIFDRVAGKDLAVIKLEDYPMCMSYGLNQLWLGDKKGNVHLIDSESGNFKLVTSFNPGHSGGVTGILHSYGTVITSSMDKTIRVLEPSLDPRNIAVLKLKGEVSEITRHKSILASSSCECSITIWIPKDWDFSMESEPL